MAVYKRDIADINLETGNIHRTFLNHSIGLKDQKADHFGVRVFRDGEPVNLSGVSVQGVFMPPQGSPIAITSGNIVSGNVAEVVLPQACYNYDGQFCLAIKLVDATNSVTGTVRIVDGMVDNTHASGTVAPTSAVPTYQEVLSVYEQAIAAISTVNAMAGKMAVDITAGAEATSNNSFKDLGNRWMTFRRGYYSTPSAGSTSSYTDDVNYVYALVACAPGDVLHAHGYGDGTSKSAWAFLDSSLKILDKGGSGNYEGATDPAPTSTAFALVNVKLASLGSGYYGWTGPEAIKDQIATLKDAVSEDGNIIYSRDLKSALETDSKAFGKVVGCYPINPTGYNLRKNNNQNVGTVIDLTSMSSSDGWKYWIVPCSEGDQFTINGNGGNNFRPYCFLDSDSKLLEKASGSSASNLVVTAPANTAKIFIQDYDETFQFVGVYSNIFSRINTFEAATNAEFKEIKDTVGRKITINKNATQVYVPFVFNSGDQYLITNQCSEQISFRTKATTSSSDVLDQINVSAGKTAVLTCSYDAGCANPYASGVTGNVIVEKIGTIDYRVTANEKAITEVNTEIGSLESFDLTIKNKVTVPKTATVSEAEYHFTNGNRYKITNTGSGSVSFRVAQTSSGDVTFISNVGAGRTVYWDCDLTGMNWINLYSSKDYNVIVDDTTTTDYIAHNNQDRIYNLETGGFPSYFSTMMTAKLPVIINNMNEVGDGGDSYVFITDIHWNNNSNNSPSLIKYIIDRTNIMNVISGGDMINEGERMTMMNDMLTIVHKLEFPFHHNLLVAFGNHDSNMNQDDWQDKRFDVPTVYSIMLKEAESYITRMTDYDLSFYYDNKANKTRYIVLDTGEDRSGSGRVFSAYNELGSVLNATETGWTIVIVAHIVTYGKFYNRVRGMLDAYNARNSSYSFTDGDVTYTFNFANGVANILYCMGGHTHIDSIEYTSGGIPVIVTDTDSRRTESTDYPYVKGTDQEQCFDVVSAKYSTKLVKLTRIGRGVNRAVHCEKNTVSGTLSLTPDVVTATGWESSNTAVATVASGTVSAVATGSCNITATDADGNMEVWFVSVA